LKLVCFNPCVRIDQEEDKVQIRTMENDVRECFIPTSYYTTICKICMHHEIKNEWE
jgi:hypothetical protein